MATKGMIVLLFAALASLIPGLDWLGRILVTVVEYLFLGWFAMFLLFVGVLLFGRRALA